MIYYALTRYKRVVKKHAKPPLRSLIASKKHTILGGSLKKRKDIIINYDTSENYYVRTHVKTTPLYSITVYVYRKELFSRERVAKINIILLFPKILGNVESELEREVYERVR